MYENRTTILDDINLLKADISTVKEDVGYIKENMEKLFSLVKTTVKENEASKTLGN